MFVFFPRGFQVDGNSWMWAILSTPLVVPGAIDDFVINFINNEV